MFANSYVLFQEVHSRRDIFIIINIIDHSILKIGVVENIIAHRALLAAIENFLLVRIIIRQ